MNNPENIFVSFLVGVLFGIMLGGMMFYDNYKLVPRKNEIMSIEKGEITLKSRHRVKVNTDSINVGDIFEFELYKK